MSGLSCPLSILLTIRERKYEIGVLMSLGEKRVKIIGQFFAELVVVLEMIRNGSKVTKWRFRMSL